MTLKIFQVRHCPFARRARIVLAEKNIAHEVVYFDPKQRPDELTALGPDAKSPTIRDVDGTWLWESVVVAEYLDERYPQPIALMPASPVDRARVRLYMRDVESKLMPTLGPVVQEVIYKPAAERDAAKVADGIQKFRSALDIWEGRLERRHFLVADALSLADILVYTPIASIARMVGDDARIPVELEQLNAWHRAMSARPSVVASEQ